MKYGVALALAVLLPTTGCGHRAEQRAEYPYASVDAIPPSHDADRWQFVESFGATAGPFKPTGDHQLNSGPGKSVSYGVPGARATQILNIDEEVLVRRFVNPQGEPLLLVYKRLPAASN